MTLIFASELKARGSPGERLGRPSTSRSGRSKETGFDSGKLLKMGELSDIWLSRPKREVTSLTLRPGVMSPSPLATPAWAVFNRLADFSHIDTPPWRVLNPVSSLRRVAVREPQGFRISRLDLLFWSNRTSNRT